MFRKNRPAPNFGEARVPLLSQTAESDRNGDRSMQVEDEAKTGRKRPKRKTPRLHHNVYVVYLRNPKGNGKAGYYVGMTGLSPEERFANHKAGIKAARVVRRYGERLVPSLYEHLKPMPYEEALAMEKQLFEELKARGFQVFGGH